MGVPVGLVLSTVVVNIVQGTTGSSFLVWGWRIPFFLSALLVIIGLYIRLSVLETPLFKQVKEQKHEASAPIIKELTHADISDVEAYKISEDKRVLAPTD